MAANLEELEKQARALPLREKAALARTLLEELDTAADADAERLWLEEAQQRYDAYAAGQMPALPGDEVM
ncbi:MAG TPA: addiction module protein, partial [Thermoanaerobaculia bacterium]|nr:addiction module protein [Thermoanaerobaculia bacterium]